MLTISVTLDHEETLPWKERSLFDIRAVAPHVDYLTLSVAAGYGNRDELLSRTSLATLARGLTAGKPVVWNGLRCGLTLPASDGMRSFQREMHAWGLELTRESFAAGSVGDQFIDLGNRKNNTGLYATPTTATPALAAYTEHSNQLRSHRPIPRPWKGKRFDMKIRGDSLFDTLANISSNSPAAGDFLVEAESRHRDFKRRSTTLHISPLLDNSPSPLDSVNAEWGSIRQNNTLIARLPAETLHIEGRAPIHLELLNTGMPTWSAAVKGLINTVWVEVRHDTLQPKYLPLQSTHFGEHASVVWHPHGYGKFQLRPLLWATGGFGEALDVEISLQNP